MKRAKRLKTKGIYFLYRFLQALGLPVLFLYFLMRGLRNREYWRSVPQRFGFLPHSFKQTGPGAIWLHAVSVGEVLSCVEFLRRARAEFPRTRFFLSTATVAGRAAARDKLTGLTDGIFYAPVDYAFAVRRVLRTIRPTMLVVAETEIWPNLFRETRRTGAGLMIINGRISDRAYRRYLLLRRWFAAVLAHAELVLAQSDEIRERFLRLGAPPDAVRTAGSFKYDFAPQEAPPESAVRRLVDGSRPAKVWIAASTMPPAGSVDPDEDDVVIEAFRKLSERHRDLLLILVPRKPERFGTASAKLDAAGVRYVRRSQLGEENGAGPPELPYVLLLDSIGELSGLFGSADVVFMGGTLAQRGGHNILEPALFAKPVVAGPHMENFRAIAEQFREERAWVEISGPEELATAVDRLLAMPEAAREIGRRALACGEARRGATAKAVAELRRLYDCRVPGYRPAMPWYEIRWALAQVWEWESRRRQIRDVERRRELDIPVISIGNLTMGGTGKTPCVLRLTALLKRRGRAVGILTRGYRRGSPEKHLVLAPGAAVKAHHSGDEPQIFVRSRLAPVGVGKNRFQVGTLLRNEFHVDVILLDDGFQHRRLGRSVDVVLIDSLNPFGGGAVFPLGRLREPMDGLARADIILITRSDYSDAGRAVEREIRKWNTRAPIFRARVEPLEWVEHRTGLQYPVGQPPFERPGGFCGLGNPQSFRRTLEGLGLEPVSWVEFEDHHKYRPRELTRISYQAQAQGAAALVTTEKDAINLCDLCDDLVAPLPLYWLKVGMAIEEEDRLMEEIAGRL